jgi:hypothetical protein
MGDYNEGSGPLPAVPVVRPDAVETNPLYVTDIAKRHPAALTIANFTELCPS